MLYAKDFRRTAFEALKGHWALAVGTGLVACIFGANENGGGSFGSTSRYQQNHSDWYSNGDASLYYKTFFVWMLIAILIFLLIYFIIGGAVKLGYCRFNLNLINGTNPQFKDLFSKFDIIWKACGMQILVALYTFLWSLLLIIPGIIAAISYSMTPYILEENPSLGVNEAIGLSKEMMDGNKWRYFCLNLSFIGWELLCIFTFGIGLLWLNPYIAAANAAFYNDVSGKNLDSFNNVFNQ